jgi:magnesium-transporting ATPase (P-type)
MLPGISTLRAGKSTPGSWNPFSGSLTCATTRKRTGTEGRSPSMGTLPTLLFLVAGKKARFDRPYFERHFKLKAELPFDSDRKKMSVIYQNHIHHQAEAYIKGAPDFMLEVSNRIYDKGAIRPMTDRDRDKILAVNHSFAENALRVIALAFREVPEGTKYENRSD